MTDASTPFLPNLSLHDSSMTYGDNVSQVTRRRSSSGLHTPPRARSSRDAASAAAQTLLASSLQTQTNVPNNQLPEPTQSGYRTDGARIMPHNLFAAAAASSSRSNSISNVNGPSTPARSRTNTQAQLLPPIPVSPGHPQFMEPPDSIGMREVASGRLSKLDADTTLSSLKPIPVRKGSALPAGEIVGVGASPTRKEPHSILSRIAIPSLKTQLIFRRNLSIIIWGFSVIFLLLPPIAFLYIHFGTPSLLPPSTFHHKDRDGPFYSSGVRAAFTIYGIAYLSYVSIVTIWSLKRASFFPFKIRPLLLVHASNLWGLLILGWVWSRYVLSDVHSFDGGDGLFPPCIISQLVVGLFQIGLVLPYILRSWQLARIFNASYQAGATGGAQHKFARERHDPNRLSASSNRGGGLFVPPSPSLNSAYDYEPASAYSVESTPRLQPQPFPSVPHPSPKRSFLTRSLTNGLKSASSSGRRENNIPITAGVNNNAGINSASSSARRENNVPQTPPHHSRGASHAPQWSTPSRRLNVGVTGAYSHTICSVPASPAMHGVTSSIQRVPHDSPGRGGGPDEYHYQYPSGTPPTNGRAAMPDLSPLYAPALQSPSSAPSPFLSPIQGATTTMGSMLPNFPALDAGAQGGIVVPVAGGVGDSERKGRGRRSRLMGCLDNLNDHKLSWIYFLLLLPFVSVSVLSYFLPSLQPLTDFYCTDHGNDSLLARVTWSCFGMLEVIGFALGLYATRRVWDGFEIRRELGWAIGIQSCLIAITLASIFTHRDQTSEEPSGDTLHHFDAFLAMIHELFLILRSILFFHLSVALPLCESFDMDALPVTRARVRMGAGGTFDPSSAFELRDRSTSVSVHEQRNKSGRNHRAESNASDSSVVSGMMDSNASSAAHSKRGSRIRVNASSSGESHRNSFSKPAPSGMDPSLHTALLADNPNAVFPMSASNLEEIAYGFAQQSVLLPPQGSHHRHVSSNSIPLTLTYIVSHPDYFHFFVDYMVRDPQTELLWTFYISIVLFQDMDLPNEDGLNQASEYERKEMAQKIYQQFFDTETLKGNTMFSQWILSMANVLQHESCVRRGTVPPDAAAAHSSSMRRSWLGERETIEALERVDEEIQHIAAIAFNEDEEVEIPRDLFDSFQGACMEIMEVWFYPKFLRSRHYQRLLREIQKSAVIQARIEQAHFLSS